MAADGEADLGAFGAVPERARLGGEKRQVSVLFADLAGFTAFSEDRSASEVIQILNRYWAAVVPAVVHEVGASR